LSRALLDQLLAVGDDQGSAAAAADQLGEDDGLAGAGGERHQGPPHAALGGGLDRLDGLDLVVAQRQAHRFLLSAIPSRSRSSSRSDGSPGSGAAGGPQRRPQAQQRRQPEPRGM
jgi:hypothetical protein